uniref:Kin of IRRE-like protein 3 n=1 Tax=Hirondellea gigas TaxID=1518452 RepID=A0A2P2I5N8_9CRUS
MGGLARTPLLVALVVILQCLQGCRGVQTFQEEPRYTEVNPGESTLLTCKVYNMRGVCSWQKDGLPQGMFTGKYEWSGERSSGDCSLRVLDVAEVDDGEWECQVTASAFTAQDALTSTIARLVVRVAPDPPYLQVGHTPAVAGRNFTVREGKLAAIKCITRYGNPAARFRWFIGSEELPSNTYNHSNSTEPDRPKLWRSMSVLHTSYVKADHGRQVRCLAVHEAYEARSLDVSVLLDVQYAPTVTLEGAPEGDIEEGVDSVSLKCIADSNPPSNVMWRREGDQNVFSFQDTVKFDPVTRKHTATYTCEARNAVGASHPISVEIDVKYPPFEIEVGPSPFVTAGLHNHTQLECHASGNPPPAYTWLQQRMDGSDRAQVRGQNATFSITAATYAHQGNYICVASNHIKGKERRVQSEPIQLEVVGAPEVMRYSASPEVEVERGQDALIQIIFCSDPQPRSANWEWGSNQLETGNGNGRYVAKPLSKINSASGSDDCYAARLVVQHADHADARNYYFNVENERGADRYAVALAVREPMSMTVVIGVVVACLALLVLVTLLVLYTFKTEKWCFAHLPKPRYPNLLMERLWAIYSRDTSQPQPTPYSEAPAFTALREKILETRSERNSYKSRSTSQWKRKRDCDCTNQMEMFPHEEDDLTHNTTSSNKDALGASSNIRSTAQGTIDKNRGIEGVHIGPPTKSREGSPSFQNQALESKKLSEFTSEK